MNTLKKVLAQIVLALLFGVTAYVLLAGIDGVWAQDVTAEPVAVTAEPAVVPDAPVITVPDDAPVVVVNIPAVESAPERDTNDLYRYIIVAGAAVTIVGIVVLGIRDKKPVVEVDNRANDKVIELHVQHIASLESLVNEMRAERREELRRLAGGIDALSKFLPLKTVASLAELAKDATDEKPSTFGQDAVG